jgi:hypothetical protein
MVKKYSALAWVDDAIRYTTAARMNKPPMINFIRPVLMGEDTFSMKITSKQC